MADATAAQCEPTGPNVPLTRWDALLTFAPWAIAALTVRVLIAPLVGHPVDMHTFIEWGRTISEVGVQNFYDTQPNCDYFPGYLYVLWVCGKIAGAAPPTFQYLIFKLPNLLTDVGIAWMIWRVAGSSPRRFVLPLLYLFNPVIIFNSAYWGQADGFHTFIVLAGLILCFNKRLVLAAVVLGFACTVKPHSVLAIPLVIVAAWMQGTRLARLLICCGIGLAAFLVPFVPFALGTNPFTFTLDRIRITMDMYPYASVNALNLWYAAGQNWIDDSTLIWGIVRIRVVGIVCVSGGAALMLWQLLRSGGEFARQYWRVAAGLFMLTFFCSTRVHERHVYPAFAMLLCAAPLWNKAFYAYALLSLTCFVNMMLAWGYIYANPPSAQLGPVALTVGICLLNCLILAVIVSKSPFNLPSGQVFFYRVGAFVQRMVQGLSKRNGLTLMAIVLFALTMRIIRLDKPETRVFDEVYHAYTAEQWAQGNTDPWRWDTSAPDKDCAYEWTHPPLAKLIMSASIRLFGVNAFAWRLPSAIAGTICILLIYALGKKLFASQTIAILAAAFMSLDALPLVLSRIAMNDMYCVMFVLAGAFACLHRRHFASAALIGCAIACKWTGLFALPLIAVIHFQYFGESIRERPLRWALTIVGQGLLVAIIYVGSYAPFFRAGNSPSDFVELQRRMWGYHVGGDLTHDGASKAWQWPLGDGTLWFYSKSFDHEPSREDGIVIPPKRANIYAMGNLMIWWAGLGAAAFCVLRTIRHPKSPLTIAVFGYLAFWVPWVASPRIMFIYHYFPALPFLYLLLAWSLVKSEVDVLINRSILATATLVLAVELPYVLGLPLPVP